MEFLPGDLLRKRNGIYRWQFVYVSSDDNGTYTWANAPFKASIVAVYENSLILSNVSPSTSSTPLPNALIEGWNGASDTGAEARAGVYRFATEDTSYSTGQPVGKV